MGGTYAQQHAQPPDDGGGGIQAVVGPSAASGGVEVHVGNPALATIRQIAYEIDETVKVQLSHLLQPEPHD